MSNSSRDVHLPPELCNAAEQRFAARFGSLDNFLTYVLEQLVRDDVAQMDREEERIIEERLKDLGYI